MRYISLILILLIAGSAYWMGKHLIAFKPVEINNQYIENRDTIRQLQSLEANWSIAAMQVYLHPDSNFDRLAEFLPQMRHLKQKLSLSEISSDQMPDPVKNLLMQFIFKIQNKEESIERFKSLFAIMRNSIKYFPLATEQSIDALNDYDPEASQSLAQLARRIDAFLKNPDEGKKVILLAQLSEWEQQLSRYPTELSNPLSNLIAHARVLIERKIQLNQVLNDIINSNAQLIGDELVQLYHHYYEQQQQSLYAEQNQAFKQALFSAIALLILALTAALLLLIQSLRWRKSLDQQVQKRTAELEAMASAQADPGMVDKRLDQNLEGMGNMAATVAHEINTPLGYLDSNLQVLNDNLNKVQQLVEAVDHLQQDLKQVDDPEKIKARIDNFAHLSQNLKEEAMLEDMPEIIHDMRDGIQQIQHITTELRDFTRKDRAKQDWFDMNQCIAQTLKMAKKEIPAGTQIAASLKEVPKLYGSPAEINQVLMNLIINAAHAVEASDRENGAINIKVYEQDGQVFVSIIDNGIGIDKETQKKIFQPFFTTKEVGKGTGLGLAIVRRIILKHKGRLYLKSVPGKGTNFTFSLPIKKSADGQQSKEG